MANFNRQRGQSMVEYVVVLVALTTALYTMTDQTDADEHDLLGAVHERYTAQNYALRLTELPVDTSITSNDKLKGYDQRLQPLKDGIEDSDQDKLAIITDAYDAVLNSEDFFDLLDNVEQLISTLIKAAVEEFIKGIPETIIEMVKSIADMITDLLGL